jgi:hypothetical protein
MTKFILPRLLKDKAVGLSPEKIDEVLCIWN